MGWIDELRFLLKISRSQGIVRRYFVVNGFDGALTVLGMILGFWHGGPVAPDVVLGACLGAAVALGVSGVSSAYISESAEQTQQLQRLRDAMITDLEASAHARSVRIAPWLVAAANGLAPFLLSLLILAPLFLATRGLEPVGDPLVASMVLAVVLLFLLGVFLGRMSNTFWLWSGLRTIALAGITGLLVFLVA